MLTLAFYAQNHPARSVIPNVLGSTELLFTQYSWSYAVSGAEQPRPIIIVRLVL